MKCLTLIIQATARQALTDCLRDFSLISCEGHYREDIHKPFLSTRNRVVGYVPRVRVDLLLENCDVEPVLQRLRQDDSGVAGLGQYWVTEVEKEGCL